ncbi:glutathione S-transferase N-terminal domain-containing protein [Alkalilimnicola sp. S0819]|uniref:glutathione S-transferase N-terminal domain-containing protein n=1 Tax=Alkalilimnicola sp. S0819 TaxID=2613922 RepID=UPI001D015A52|nr:glutathione S-transferase N-terminal domain-containing protein [Alkalilimnicola sp. S0819]
MELFELAGTDDRRFSPYCWRSRFALAHKGLKPRITAIRYTDKAAIAFSGQDKVPVVADGERVVSDSWAIACYLEERYPHAPSLFGGEGGRQLAHFFNLWCDTQINARLVRAVALDLHDRLQPEDRSYFRRTREQRFGMRLEDAQAERPRLLEEIHQALSPVRALLAEQAWLHGETPAYADYILLGTFQWIRAISALDPLADDRPLRNWRERGLARLGVA